MAALATASLKSAVRTSPTQAIESTSSISNEATSTTLKLLEGQVDQLLLRISPTEASAAQRDGIVTFVQKLVKRCFQQCGDVDAWVFGSVALKAYLPDGDIDFSLFQRNGAPLKDTWASRLFAALQRQQNKPPSNGFSIRNPQIINAEVKLVKFLVNDVIVDVSFETLGGLCTVNFLQEVDLHIGRQQLFKRSVILCKAWCYYESRLLGANHGLLSSYALEILVLHICNLHHATAHTPLQVLHHFLQVYSTLGWDQYCLTLSGPVPIASLQGKSAAEVTVPPAPEGALLNNVLLGELMESCKASGEHGPDAFLAKFMNIQDPMLPANNLGRSISKANAARIRTALSHAAAQLSCILQQGDPGTALSSLARFFQHTGRARPTLSRPPSAPQLQQLQLSGLGPGQPLQLTSLQHVMDLHPRQRLPPHAQQRGHGAAARQQRPGGASGGPPTHSDAQQSGFLPSFTPTDLQRLHSGGGGNGTNPIPNLRRGLSAKDGSGRGGLHQRMGSYGGDRNVGRSKSSHAASFALAAGNAMEASRGEGQAAASTPTTPAMYRSYSADTSFSAAQLLTSAGMPLNGCLDTQPLLNGFAQHSGEARLQPSLQGAALTPEQQLQLHQQLQAQLLQHQQQQQKRQQLKHDLRLASLPVDASSAGPNQRSAGTAQGSDAQPAAGRISSSVPSSPARRHYDTSQPPAYWRQQPGNAPPEQSSAAIDHRPQRVGSVRSNSSGSLGLPPASRNPIQPPIVVMPPPRQGPPPPPSDAPPCAHASHEQGGPSSVPTHAKAGQAQQAAALDAAAASKQGSWQPARQQEARLNPVAAAQAAAQRALQSPTPGSVRTRSEPRMQSQRLAKEQVTNRPTTSRAASPPSEVCWGDLFPATTEPSHPQPPPAAAAARAAAANSTSRQQQQPDAPNPTEGATTAPQPDRQRKEQQTQQRQQRQSAPSAPEPSAVVQRGSSKTAHQSQKASMSPPEHSAPLAAPRQWPPISSAPPSIADFDAGSHPGSPSSSLPMRGAAQLHSASPPRQLHIPSRRSTAVSEGSAAPRSLDSASSFPATFGSPTARSVSSAPREGPCIAGQLAPLTTAEYPPLQANGMAWPPSLHRSSAPAAASSFPLANGHLPSEAAAAERLQRVSYKAAMSALKTGGRGQNMRSSSSSSRDDMNPPRGAPPAPPSSVGSQAGGDTPRSAASAPGGASATNGGYFLPNSSVNGRNGATHSAGVSPRGQQPQHSLDQAPPLASSTAIVQQQPAKQAAPTPDFALVNDDFPALAMQQPAGKRGSRKGSKAPLRGPPPSNHNRRSSDSV